MERGNVQHSTQANPWLIDQMSGNFPAPRASNKLIVGLFAVVALVAGAFMGLLPFGAVVLPNGHHVNMPEFIPAIDWGVVTIRSAPPTAFMSGVTSPVSSTTLCGTDNAKRLASCNHTTSR